MSETFDIGDLVRLKAAFTDAESGAAIDPDTVAFRVREPDGTLTDYAYPAEVTKTAVGAYQVDVDADQAGSWRWRVFSTGNGQAAEEDGFTVRKSKTV